MPDLHAMTKKGRALLDRHGLKHWRFAVEDLGTLFACPQSLGPLPLLGISYQRHKFISVNWHYPRQFRQTCLHEIAHALRGAGVHDRTWARIALQIGCTRRHVHEHHRSLGNSWS